LIAFCCWEDSNGAYTDDAAVTEFGSPIPTTELRARVESWQQDLIAKSPVL
jgi:hypothetical protein